MATELTTNQWIEILQNGNITKELGLAMLQTLYSFEDHKAYASQVGMILGVHHGALNFEVGRYAKRIAENYDVNFTARSQKKYKFWDLFFNGWEEGSKFVWQLRPELVEALERSGLSGDEHLPNELPDGISASLFEGIKRSVIVNAYERNPRARALCVSHWQAICSVCEFNFRQYLREIG